MAGRRTRHRLLLPLAFASVSDVDAAVDAPERIRDNGYELWRSDVGGRPAQHR